MTKFHKQIFGSTDNSFSLSCCFIIQ